MPFQRIAQVTSLATFEVDGEGGFKVVASAAGTNAQRLSKSAKSHFLGDGSRVFDVQGLFDRVADDFAISRDPSKYFFEAIRANTTNAPNENNDAFHRDELLRFDVKLGMPVYMTYSGKPHHINHVTSNPKAARGVIIDSYYNDTSPALDACPACTTKTAERQNRDASGLHCKKCGTLVKDEFVEILVAIDSQKDKRFAEAVRSGQLKAGSMGCNCLSTTCNVCSHVAYSKPEFCEHIRTGNKGSLWKREGSRWTKTNATEVKRELQRRKVAFVPHDFCFVKTGDFEVRRAFENCVGVVFDEYSRVDQPADPKALQVEVLKVASVLPSADQMAAETEALIRSAELKQQRAAQRTHADMAHDGVGIQMQPGDDPLVVEAPPGVAGEEQGLLPPDGVPPDGMMPGAPEGMPGAPGGAAPGMSIDQYTENQVQDPMSAAETGMPGQVPPQAPNPPGAAAPQKKGQNMRTFDAAYRKWTVQVSEQGNARVVTAAGQPVLIVRGQAEQDPDARRTFGRQVFASLLNEGLLVTAKKFKGVFSPRFAQVVEGGVNDMVGFDDHEMHGTPLEDGVNDMQGVDREKTVPDSTHGGADDDDMQGDVRGTPPDMATEGGEMDHARNDENVDNVTEPDGSDMREKRKPVNLKTDSVLDDITLDHKEPVSGKRGSLALGAKISHRGDGMVATVVGVHQTMKGTQYQISNGKKTATISESDMTTTWQQLDKQPGTLKLPGKPTTQMVTAAEKCSKCGDAHGEDAKCGDKSAVFASRLQKVTAAKLAKADAAVKAAQQSAEEQVAVAKGAAIDSFVRALRIAARRQEVGLEASPIKLAAEAVLSETREIGRNAADGQPIVYQGLDSELTRYLVAEMFSVGHGDHLNSLIERAASLMSRGEQYLLDAEADARNLSHSLPPMTAAVSTRVDEAGLHAEAMRRQALNGNLHLNPQPPLQGAVEGHDRRAALQRALGGTVVGSARVKLGLN